MTDEQKIAIAVLRRKGVGYKTIAKELELSVNTVKSHCRRNPSIYEKHICLFCGKPVEQTPGRREKKFCSNSCRMKWWSAHPEKSRDGVKLVCSTCGKEFIAYRNAKRKYCSHACYIKDRFEDGQNEQEREELRKHILEICADAENSCPAAGQSRQTFISVTPSERTLKNKKSHEERERELLYQSMMHIIRALHGKGIMSFEAYAEAGRMMRKSILRS